MARANLFPQGEVEFTKACLDLLNLCQGRRRMNTGSVRYPMPLRDQWETPWGKGAWSHEPNEVAWVEARTQLPCALMRSVLGVWCGYTAVPPGHPLHGHEQSDAIQLPVSFIEKAGERLVDIDRDVGVFNLFMSAFAEGDPLRSGYIDISLALPAHGGLTYAGADEAGWWWYGFDAAHAGDLVPALMLSRSSDRELRRALRSIGRSLVYRDQSYMLAQCNRLAWHIEELRQAIEG